MAEREPLSRYATECSLPLSEAARRLIRQALTKVEKAPDRTLEDLSVLILIAVEQVRLGLEAIMPAGPGATDQLQPSAIAAAQLRMTAMVGGEGDGQDA